MKSFFLQAGDSACKVLTGRKNYGIAGSRSLTKIYKTRFGGSQVEALHDVNFAVEKGNM